MRKKADFLFVFLCFFLNPVFAQIDLPSGSASYTVPVYSYVDPKSGLSQAFGISYFSGQGIKVSQMASNVGLGWNLVGGGEIIRIMHGLPDDQYDPEPDVINMSDNVASNMIYEQTNASLYQKYYPNGFLYKVYDINYWPRQMAFQPRFGVPGAAVYGSESSNYKMAPKAGEDTEQDEFMVNVNGIQKTFVIGRNFQVIYSDKSLLKTEIIKEELSDMTLYGQNVITKIKGFVITDEQGIQYRFDKYELEDLVETEMVNNTPYIKYQKPIGKRIINKWVLTSVREPVSDREIVFEYNDEHWEYVPDISYQFLAKEGGNGASSTKIFTYSSTYKKTLKRIIFPDNKFLQLNYNTVARKDLTGSFTLNSIGVHAAGGFLLKKIDLDLGYFWEKQIVSATGLNPLAFTEMSTSGGDPRLYGFYSDDNLYAAYSYRLALRKITIWEGMQKEKQEYVFSYYTGSESADPTDRLPSRMSKNRDYSGLYYKGGDWGALSIANFYPGQLHAGGLEEPKLGCLKSVQEPLGATISYEYKYYRLTLVNKYGVLVSKIVKSDNTGNTNYTKAYGYPSLDASTGIASTVYNTNSWVVPQLVSNKYWFTYVKDDLRARSGNILSPFCTYIIKEVISSAVTGAIGTKLTNNMSSALNPMVSYVVSNIVSGLIDVFFGSNTVETNIFASTHRLQLDNNPFPTQLAAIREYDVINNNFVPAKYYGYSYITNGITPYDAPWSSRQLVDPNRYGNPTLIEYYDKDGNVVYKQEKSYSYDGSILDDNFRSIKYAPVKLYSVPYIANPVADGIIGNDWIISDAYNYKAGCSLLAEEIETQVNTSGGGGGSMHKYYSSNASNKQIGQSYLLNSNGKLVGSNIYYAIDAWNLYPGNAVLQKLKASNRVNTPVAEITWYRNGITDNVYYVTGVNIINYDLESLKPSVNTGYRIETPIAVSLSDLNEFNAFALPAWLSNTPSEVTRKNSYTGPLLTETRKNDDDKNNAIKYDATSYLPIATITNASATDVSYTSFESGSGSDGWQYSQDACTYEPEPVSSPTSFTLSNAYFIDRQGLNTAKAYRITVWAKLGASVYVNETAGLPLYQKNGWVLLQFIVTGTTAVQVTGDGKIDELRLLPVNARMNTVYYDPVTGLTKTESDAGNRMTYYEYDSWERLVLVRDDNFSVVKRYCYSFPGQPSDCTEHNPVVESKCEQVYAKITYENYSSDNSNTRADIVVRFYADENCTNACQARNLTVNYAFRDECWLMLEDEGFEIRHKTVNGWYATLEKAVVVMSAVPNPCPNPPCQALFCNRIYGLADGTAYTPVRDYLFESEERSQVFTKADCPENTVPYSVNYIVPAGKYTSFLSQKHANEQAEKEMELHGQETADAGTCTPSPQAIYCKLVVEEGQFGSDIVVYFYSDEACTQPFSVYNLDVYYERNDDCGFVGFGSVATVTGTSYVLEEGVMLRYLRTCPPGQMCHVVCEVSYALAESDGYTIVP